MALEKECDEERIDAYFKKGVDASDSEEMFSLLQSAEIFRACSAIFRGSDAGTVAKIYVLQKIALHKNQQAWTPVEIRMLFGDMDEDRLDLIIKRLRETGILDFEMSEGIYHVSSMGRMVMSAINSMKSYAGENEGDLGFIYAQIAGDQAMRENISVEGLKFLLHKLGSLKVEFEDAVVSGSENRIRIVEKRISKVQKFVEKGSEQIDNLTSNIDMSFDAYRLAQEIGRSQSTLLNATSTIHRTLNSLERQRIDLGGTGMTISDIDLWLQEQDIETIAGMANRCIGSLVHPAFILSDLIVDSTEDTFLDEGDGSSDNDEVMPPPMGYQEGTADFELQESLDLLEEWVPVLGTIDKPLQMHDLIKSPSFAESSYLMSLLSLIGMSDEIPNGAIGNLMKAPIVVKQSDGVIEVDHEEVAEMSRVEIEPSKDKNHE